MKDIFAGTGHSFIILIVLCILQPEVRPGKRMNNRWFSVKMYINTIFSFLSEKKMARLQNNKKTVIFITENEMLGVIKRLYYEYYGEKWSCFT